VDRGGQPPREARLAVLRADQNREARRQIGDDRSGHLVQRRVQRSGGPLVQRLVLHVSHDAHHAVVGGGLGREADVEHRPEGALSWPEGPGQRLVHHHHPGVNGVVLESKLTPFADRDAGDPEIAGAHPAGLGSGLRGARRRRPAEDVEVGPAVHPAEWQHVDESQSRLRAILEQPIAKAIVEAAERLGRAVASRGKGDPAHRQPLEPEARVHPEQG